MLVEDSNDNGPKFMRFVQQSCNQSTLEVPSRKLELIVKRIDEVAYPTN